MPSAPKAVKGGRRGNIEQIISPIAQNCQEVIVIDGKYFPEIHRPVAPFQDPRPVYDKTQFKWRRRGGVTNSALD